MCILRGWKIYTVFEIYTVILLNAEKLFICVIV